VRVKGVHQSIIDVEVASNAPGEITLYPLLDTGLPGVDMLALIAAAVSGERVRPLTDHVNVVVPEQVDYQIAAELTLYKSADAEVTLAAARAAAQAWANERAAGLGRDIVPVQVEAAIKVAGVYDIARSSPPKIVVESHQWAHCTGINIEFAGVADG
jgi:phage-related baseplate assembly protein